MEGDSHQLKERCGKAFNDHRHGFGKNVSKNMLHGAMRFNWLPEPERYAFLFRFGRWRVDRIEVKWVGGSVEAFEGMKTDQILILKEKG